CAKCSGPPLSILITKDLLTCLAVAYHAVMSKYSQFPRDIMGSQIFDDERLPRKVNQYRVEAILEPLLKNFKAAILRPKSFHAIPAVQLAFEDFHTCLPEALFEFLFEVTFWQQIDGRIAFEVCQRDLS